jgi:C2 domain/Calponin homology (CH) domain
MQEKIAAKESQVMSLHAKTFGAWANSHLLKRTPPLRINDVSADFSDGLLLIALVEQLSSSTCSARFNRAPKLAMQKLDNLTVALAFVNGFLRPPKLQVAPKEVHSGDLKSVLAVLWRLILHFQVAAVTCGDGDDSSGKSATDMLLRWAQHKTDGYRHVGVRDYARSFQDGMAFCALVHRYDPDIVDFEQLTPARAEDNLRLAFALANRHMGVPILIDPADMVHPDPSCRPDEHCIVTYLSQFPAAFAKIDADERERQRRLADAERRRLDAELAERQRLLANAEHQRALDEQERARREAEQAAAAAEQQRLAAEYQRQQLLQQQQQQQQQQLPQFGAAASSSSSNNFGSATTFPNGNVAILIVTVLEARGLRTCGAFSSKPDPYCVLTCYRQKEKTKKVRKELNPKWNAEFKFYVEDPQAMLSVEVFNWDRLMSDEFLGYIEVPFAQIKVGITEEHWFSLANKTSTQRVTGEIALRFHLSF